MRRKIAALVAGIAVLALSAGFAYLFVSANTLTTYVDVIREKPYNSLRELVADSTLVAVVQISEDEAAVLVDKDGKSGPSTTTVSAELVEIVATPGAIPFAEGYEPEVGDEISVSQFGVPGALTGVELEAGQTYMLFLTPSLISGAPVSNYLPVGVWSGVYLLADDAKFHQVKSEGDLLPATVTTRQVVALGFGAPAK